MVSCDVYFVEIYIELLILAKFSSLCEYAGLHATVRPNFCEFRTSNTIEKWRCNLVIGLSIAMLSPKTYSALYGCLFYIISKLYTIKYKNIIVYVNCFCSNLLRDILSKITYFIC